MARTTSKAGGGVDSLLSCTVHVPQSTAIDPNGVETEPFIEPISDSYVEQAREDEEERIVYLAWLLRTEEALNSLRNNHGSQKAIAKLIRQVNRVVKTFDLNAAPAGFKARVEIEAQVQDALMADKGVDDDDCDE